MVGQRPEAFGLRLVGGEAQYFWVGHVGCGCDGDGVKILRLLHSVDVGGCTAVAENHQFVAFVQLAFLVQLFVYPSQWRLQCHAGTLFVVNRDGVEVYGTFFRSAFHGYPCHVGGQGGGVDLLRHVNINAEVLGNPLAEPSRIGEVHGAELEDFRLAVADGQAHLSRLVVGTHVQRDALDGASLPALKPEHGLAVARNLVVAVSGGSSVVVLEIRP